MVDSNDALFMNKSTNFTNAVQTLKIKVYPCDVFTQPVLFVCSRNDPHITVLLQSCIYCLHSYNNNMHFWNIVSANPVITFIVSLQTLSSKSSWLGFLYTYTLFRIQCTQSYSCVNTMIYKSQKTTAIDGSKNSDSV